MAASRSKDRPFWAAVGWVSPGNPANTFGRAVLVSVVLSIAYYVTLAKFLWFLVLPWLLYVVIWILVVMGSYGLGSLHALLVALALASCAKEPAASPSSQSSSPEEPLSPHPTWTDDSTNNFWS